MQTLFIVLFLQIVLESLPVSSSGHIFIIKNFLSISFSKKIFDVLDHFSHGPTLFILMILFWRDWSYLFLQLFRLEFTKDSYKKLVSIFFKIVRLVFIVDVITAIFYGIIKVLLADCWLLSSDFLLWAGLLVTGVGLLSLRWLPTQDRYESWDSPRAVLLGFVQGLALLPGISRFGITYVVGRWLKLSPRRSFQISFLIHVPLITAAFLRAGGKILLGSTRESFFLKLLLFSWQGLAVLALATICGYFALSLTRQWAYGNKFWRFGLYVLGLAIAMAVFFLVQFDKTLIQYLR